MKKESDDEIFYSEKDHRVMDKLIDWGDDENYVAPSVIFEELILSLKNLPVNSTYDIHDLDLVKSGKYDLDVIEHFLDTIEFAKDGHEMTHDTDDIINLKLNRLIDELPLIKLYSDYIFGIYNNMGLLEKDSKTRAVTFLKKE